MERLDQILESHMATGPRTTKDELLGAALVVVDKDGVIYQGAVGRIASAIDSPKFTPDSVSWVASMTKIVTATCAMQVVERGLIGLDDDVRPLVPQLQQMRILRGFVGADVPYLEENTSPITLRQLLTHTAGLGYGNADPDLARWAKHAGWAQKDHEGTIEAWCTPLKFRPGRGWYYGTGLDWAGRVVEALTGSTLGEYMADNVFSPLGMRDTSFRPQAGRAPVVPSSHRDAKTGELRSSGQQVMPVEPEVDSGGAGLYTTAADHARVLQALLRASAGPGGLLREETAAEMFRPQLSQAQRDWLGFITNLFHEGLVPDFERGMPLDHGISGVINVRDSAGKRRAGSMMWGGLCNGHWFIDRQSGIAVSFVTNVLPLPDEAVLKLWDALERAIYSDLLPALRE